LETFPCGSQGGLLIAGGLIPIAADAANDCGTPLKVTKALVRANSDYTGYLGDKYLPAFLVGAVRDPTADHRGTTVFVERRWTAFVPLEGEFSQGIFIGYRGKIVIFTMMATEGPGARAATPAGMPPLPTAV
jgi:hypothetical protein